MDPKKRNLDVPIYFIECNTRMDYESRRETLLIKGFKPRGTVSSDRDLTEMAIEEGVEIAQLPHFNTEGDTPSQTEFDLFTKPYNR